MVVTPVHVAVPPDPRYVRIVRMVATAAGATAGLAIDRLDDLGLALDEACSALIAVPDTTALECTITSRDERVSVQVTGRDGAAPTWPPDGWPQSLEAIVLMSVASDVQTTSNGGQPGLSFDIAP